MQQSKQEVQNYQENEIDLRAILISLVARRFLIAGLTGFVTVLAILYSFIQAPMPVYEATSSFTSPSSISVTTINKLNLTTETKDSIFSKFLTHLSSKSLQKLAFIEGGFITTFNIDNSPIDDVDTFISGAIASVSVISPRKTIEVGEIGSLTELPYSVTMEGTSAEVISEYLNSLVDMANSKTIMDLISLNELKIDNLIEEISIEHDLLLEQAAQARFSKIERIKEEDSQKIRQINDQIDRARYKAKENRLNQIVVLTESVKLAKSLGIIENNFKLFDNETNSDLTIAIGESKDLPNWYLYGEKALNQKIKLLENRTSNDPFIPELVTLYNQLNQVQNNNFLKTLEARQDDSPFVDEIINLAVEKNKLESRKVIMNGVSSIELSQASIPLNHPINDLNKKLIGLLAFIFSFIMSIFLVLIMEVLKPNKKALT